MDRAWWTRAITLLAAIVVYGCSDYTGRGLTPNAGAHVLRVQGSGGGSGTVTAPDASPEISCTITAGALSGSCGNGYPSNSAVRLIATPNAGSTFGGWSGACAGTGDCVVEMSQERTVTASFAKASTAEIDRLLAR